MQDPNRSRRLASQQRTYDPFAGLGFGTRSSLFSDFCDRDPFDDPFFTKPFGGIFGNDSPFGSFGSQPGRTFGEQARQKDNKGPVIEELDDEEEHDLSSQNRTKQEPIVEHPDDEVGSNYSARGKRNGISANVNGSPSGMKNITQSYSSYSVSYGGPGGTYYTSSTTRREGGDGVVEEQHEEKDSRSGNETSWVMRGLRDKGHAVTRKRNASGAENFVERLHNLCEDEKQEFDQHWRKEAEKYLPAWKNHMQLENGFSGGKKSQEWAALPSNTASSSSAKDSASWHWPWAKKA